MLQRYLDNPRLPAMLLRAGIGFTFLYAAIGGFVQPNEWSGYLPDILTDRFSADVLLVLFGIYQLALVAWLCSGVYLRYAALLCAATLGGIVILSLGAFIITFRDVGLFLAALALAALAKDPK